MPSGSFRFMVRLCAGEVPEPRRSESRRLSIETTRMVSDCAESRSREVRSLRDAGDVDLAGIVDAVAQHRNALEPVADADGDVLLRIATEVTDDAVGEDT